jgi:hypothetical protein
MPNPWSEEEEEEAGMSCLTACPPGSSPILLNEFREFNFYLFWSNKIPTLHQTKLELVVKETGT